MGHFSFYNNGNTWYRIEIEKKYQISFQQSKEPDSFRFVEQVRSVRLSTPGS